MCFWRRLGGGNWYKPNDLIDITQEYPIDASGAKLFEAGLTRAVKELLAMNRKVILISDIPTSNYDVPSAYFVSATSGFININTIRPTIQEYNERQGEANAFLEKLAKLPDVILVRPEQRMFDVTGRGRVMSNGELFYIDNSHLSTAGALYVAPVFEPLFKEMARSQSAHQRVSEN
jgi:hypothetical protein